MSAKTRLATVVLSGLLLGLVAVKVERSSVPIEQAVLSQDSAVRNPALERLQTLQNTAEKNRIVGEIANSGVKSADPRRRVFALYALRKSGWKGPRVVGPIINALSDPNPKVRDEAAVGVREEGIAAFPQIFWFMGNPAVRRVAADLGQDVPPDVVPLIESAMNVPGQRRGATFFISQISRPDTLSAARRLAPAVAESMKSTDTMVAVNGAFALHTIDPKDPRPYPVFMKCVQKPNWEAWDVRGEDALNALARAPAYKDKLVPSLKGALATAPDGWLKGRRFKRQAIGDALNALAPLPKDVPALATLLKSSSAGVRWRAVYALGSSGKVDEQAFAPLVGALNDPDQVVAARAVWALERLGPEKMERAADTVYPRMIATFQRVTMTIPGFWVSAANAISGLGQRALPLTLDAVRKGHLTPDKATAIVRALGKEPDPAPFLKAALSDPNADVRVVAALGLAKFDPAAEGVAGELRADLARRKGFFRDDIQRTLNVVEKKKGTG